MDNSIGYAVFGTPRGLQVIANGIFEIYDLHNALDLSQEHITLEEGQQVLLFKRVSTTKSRNSKNALIAAIYQHAWPHGEKRAGGFVGSAICFEQYLPNHKKIAEGLWYLFNQAREQIDSNDRFLSAESATWKIDLPDASRDFGFLSSQIWQHQLQEEPQRTALLVSSMRLDTQNAIFNLCFNVNFYKYDHIYVADSDAVYKSLMQSGMGSIALPELFDYTPQMQAATALHTSLKQEVANLEAKIHRLEDDYRPKVEYLNSLEDKIHHKSNYKEKLERAISALELEYLEDIDPIFEKELKEKHKKLVNAVAESEKEYEQKKNALETINKSIRALKHTEEKLKNRPSEGKNNQSDAIKYVVREIRKYYTPEKEYDDTEIIKSYFLSRDESHQRRKKQDKKRIWLFLGLIATTLLFLGLWTYEKFFNDPKPKIEISTQNSEKNQQLQNEVDGLKDQGEVLAGLIKYNKHSAQADLQELRKLTDPLLTRFLAGDLPKNSPEYKFITNYNWEFWEIEYTNRPLAAALQIPFEETFFIDLKGKGPKPLSIGFQWPINGEQGLTDYLKMYLEEPNDFYQLIASVDSRGNVNIKNGMTLQMLLNHFQWMLKECNQRSISTFSKTERIKAPYFYLNPR